MKQYKFTAVPTYLFMMMDNNCRSMLFTLIQLSTNYADEEGWFFRTCSDLEEESNLSQNLVRATIQTLFNHNIIEVKATGQSKGKKPNYYKVNFEEFAKYDEISIEDAMKNPDLKICTVNYKGSNFKLNLVRETVTNTVKSDHNIDNIDNIDKVYYDSTMENTVKSDHNIVVKSHDDSSDTVTNSRMNDRSDERTTKMNDNIPQSNKEKYYDSTMNEPTAAARRSEQIRLFNQAHDKHRFDMCHNVKTLEDFDIFNELLQKDINFVNASNWSEEQKEKWHNSYNYWLDKCVPYIDKNLRRIQNKAL